MHYPKEILDNYQWKFLQIKLQHINLVSPGRLPLSNVDSQGFFQPQASDYSDKYLAGYEQLDFPDPTSLFPGT